MKSLALSLTLAAGLAGSAHAQSTVSFDRFDVSAPHRAGLVAAGIWSPAASATYAVEVGGNAVFQPVRAQLGAALPDARLPLVVMSHGSGGSMDAMAWLGAGLAARGALVAVLNHPGSTTGDSSPRRSVKLSERAADVSALLDHLLADPYLAARIDGERVTALGFSLGGATVLGLAGQRLDPAAYRDYCEAEADEAQDCVFFAKGGVDLENLPPEFSAAMDDPRFSKIVAVDPGLTFGATKASLAAIDAAVQVVSLGENYPWRALDVSASGSGLLDALPNAEHVVIPAAHHFSFLPLCTPRAEALLVEEGEDPICTDPAGSDRASVHAASLKAIAEFLGL